MQSISEEERVMIRADLNGYVCEGNRGDERYGMNKRNDEGQMMVDFKKRMEGAILNAWLMKKEKNRVRYKSGGRSSRMVYTLCGKKHVKAIRD